MTDNPAEKQDNSNGPQRRRGRPPGRRTVNSADEAVKKTVPVPDISVPPPIPTVPVSPPPPQVIPARPGAGDNRPNGNRPPQGNRSGRYQQGQRGYNNNRGPRREINPLDRGPRRQQTPQGDAVSPASTPKSPEEGAPPAENRSQRTHQNGRTGQPQNNNQNQNQNQNRPQQRRGRPPRPAQDGNRQNQNRQPGEPNGGNGRGGQPQNSNQNQSPNQKHNQNRPQQRRGGNVGNRPPRSAQAAPAASGEPTARDSNQNQNRQPGVKGPRKSRGVNPFVYNKPPPIKTSSGIKALSQNGSYALSWWAARWIAAMENLVDGRRLGRGRSYAKEGQVLSIEEKPGGVQAMVQGSRPRPYRVAIEVIPLSEREWDQVFDVLASQALFAAQLLAGEMPRNIEEAFDAAGTSLFPARLGDLHTDCSCPDWANPCKHVAATHYILAERFDEDPFLLFRLRGRTSEQILTALRERRSASSGDEPLFEEAPVEEVQPAPPLEANLSGFYNLGQPLDGFALSFKAPAIEMPVLKRLGDPNFLGQESLLATMEPVYRAVRESALEAALGEAKEEEASE